MNTSTERGNSCAPGFFVLVGIDGSGKSSLLNSVRVPGLVTCSWQDLRNHEVPAMLAPDAPTAIKNRVPSLSRAMFIGGHLVAQYEYLIRPLREDGVATLLDSYYFKLLAKERLFGTVHPALESLCRELPQPDGVIYVEVDPLESFRRKKGDLSPYEHRGRPTLENYVDFQQALDLTVRELIAGLPHVYVDGSLSRHALTKTVATLVGEWVAARTSAGDN